MNFHENHHIMNFHENNNNNYNNEIIIHRFVRKIRRNMNWRKRSISFNSIEANGIRSLFQFQKECISWLDYIASSIPRINKMTNDESIMPLIKSMKRTALGIVIRLSQDEEAIQRSTITYRTTNTYVITEHHHRKITDFTDSEAYNWTRLTKTQLHKLFNLFNLPNRFTVHHSHHFDSECVMILSLTYLANGENMSSLKCKFGGNPDFFFSVIKEFVQHLYEMRYMV